MTQERRLTICSKTEGQLSAVSSRFSATYPVVILSGAETSRSEVSAERRTPMLSKNASGDLSPCSRVENCAPPRWPWWGLAHRGCDTPGNIVVQPIRSQGCATRLSVTMPRSFAKNVPNRQSRSRARFQSALGMWPFTAPTGAPPPLSGQIRHEAEATADFD